MVDIKSQFQEYLKAKYIKIWEFKDKNLKVVNPKEYENIEAIFKKIVEDLTPLAERYAKEEQLKLVNRLYGVPMNETMWRALRDEKLKLEDELQVKQ